MGSIKKKYLSWFRSRVIQAAFVGGFFVIAAAIVAAFLSRSQNVVVPTEIPTLPPASVTTTSLTLTAIRPPALLERETRLYKLFGSGFSEDTAITLKTHAFVGSDSNIFANSAPAEVASDGTWISVYIFVVANPEENGCTIIVENPNGESAEMYVGYQR